MESGEILADKYRVDQVIGVGGMGVVVAATHVDLDQRVALKFLQPHAALDSSLVERFVREGKAAARLKSEHVARVLDVGRMKDGMPYIVMEFLDGNTLSAVVKQRGALPIAEAVGYVLQACDAVAEAHAMKIVHRDLKPENLFVTSRNDGRPLVKVLDFGISKALDGKSQSLTQTDSMMGSPAYMAPEQMRSSKDVDERADIWSLGAILYELTTGKLPYIAESLAALAFMLVEGPAPSLRSHVPELPEGLDAIVMRCLERDRNLRIKDIGALAKELAPYAHPDDLELVARINSIQTSQQRAAFSSLPEIVQADTMLVGTPMSTRSPIARADSASGSTPSGAAPGVAPRPPLGSSPDANGRRTGGWGATNGETPSPSAKPGKPRTAVLIGGLALVLGVVGFGGFRMLSRSDTAVAHPDTASSALISAPAAPTNEPTAHIEPKPVPTETVAVAASSPTMSPLRNATVIPPTKPKPAVSAVSSTPPTKPSASVAPAAKPTGPGNGFINERQ